MKNQIEIVNNVNRSMYSINFKRQDVMNIIYFAANLVGNIIDNEEKIYNNFCDFHMYATN